MISKNFYYLGFTYLLLTGCTAIQSNDTTGQDEPDTGEEPSALCQTDNGGCDAEASCSVTEENVVECECPEGFEGDGLVCADIDECALNNGECGDATYFTCTNNIGADPTCNDIDECALNNGECGDATYYTCSNNIGADPTCNDIDECALNNGECGDATYFTCTNNIGADPTCNDIDECALNNGECGDATYYTCSNNIGADPTCGDIDECAANNGECGDATYFTCTNNAGAAATCTDINECLTNNGGCGDTNYFSCSNNTGAAPTCVAIPGCDPVADNCSGTTSPYPENPNCSGFSPTCSSPQTLPWANQEVWTANGNAAQGAVRVLEGSYVDFQTWNGDNTSYDHSACEGTYMRDCCLTLTESDNGTNSCPVPYNDQVLTVVRGDRLTLRLPPSPCNASDAIPLSGFTITTNGILAGHQVGLCQEDDGSKYGCIHLDGLAEGAASVWATAYYGSKQDECSAAASFGTSQFGTSSTSVVTSAFGASLDTRFNNGQTGLPACCMNTMMVTVNVVEPVLSATPTPVSRDFGWEKARMAKGGVLMCNVSQEVCQAMQEPLREVIAANISSTTTKNDVWLSCSNGDFQKSNLPAGLILGQCNDTSFLNYEVYMQSQPFISAFLADPTNLQTLINRNDGSQNTTGFLNGTQPYNYVFVEAIKAELMANGLSDSILIGQAKASLSDYQVYQSNASSNFATRTWQPMAIDSWGTGVTSVAPTDALQGRTTVLSSASQASSCTNPYCDAYVLHNQLRAQLGLSELQWDTALENSAAGYADDLCRRNVTLHADDTSPYYQANEVIYAHSPGGGEDEVTPANRGTMLTRAVQAWDLERNWYTYARNGANCSTDHLYTAPDGADSYSRFEGMSGPSVYAGSISSLIPAESKEVEHFITMFDASATKIGCAAVKCSELGETNTTNMLSAQNRWVSICHYDQGYGLGQFPFSERAALAVKQDLETTSTADDVSLCAKPCDGAMTTAERDALEAWDAQVTLTAAASSYVEAPAAQCMVPELPNSNFVPAAE